MHINYMIHRQRRISSKQKLSPCHMCNSTDSGTGTNVSIFRHCQSIQLTSLPHSLVFEDDFKRDLIRIMTNMLRFRGKLSDINSLILLHGPPGTGKTTLCQGLAQKISIQLSSSYPQTKLIQIKTANLLSKYYSESAKKVDEIFTAIEAMCEEDQQQFICVLIDEVESIASSRQSSMVCPLYFYIRCFN
jgi:AAA+ superfamily predicted ATPase